MRLPGRPPLPSDAGHGERRRADGGGNRSRLPLGDEAGGAGGEADGREEGGALVEEAATYVFLMGTGPEELTDGKRAAPERRRHQPRLPACGRGRTSSRRDWRAARRRGSATRARDEAYRMDKLATYRMGKLVGIVIKYGVQLNSPHRPVSSEEEAEAGNKERAWVLILVTEHKCCEKPPTFAASTGRGSSPSMRRRNELNRSMRMASLRWQTLASLALLCFFC